MNANDITAKTKKADKEVGYYKIAYTLGLLLLFESLLLTVSCLVSLFYGEADIWPLTAALSACAAVGIGLTAAFRRKGIRLNRFESYIIVALSWIIFSLFGMMPYLIGGYTPSVADAFFETISGFTTTGATILDNIDSIPHGVLFWRSLTQWIGGLGIVCFTIVLLPGFSDNSQMLYLSEATGVTHDKIYPKTRVMARYICLVYFSLTLIETLLLMAGGMSLFDAVCQSFATTATGGFSTKQASISYWNSPFIEYVVTLFMLLSAVNFSLYLAAVRGHSKQLFKDIEVRWFLSSVAILTVIIAFTLILKNGYAPEESFRKALFQVVTCHTSCGFATDDYNLWPPFTWMLLIFAMLSGGCTGSTSGGIKSLRLVIMAGSIKNQFRQILHPRAVLPVEAGRYVNNKMTTMVFVFFATYIIIAFFGWSLLMIFGVGLTESLGTVISAMGNVGPGLGDFGPAFSWSALPTAAKWTLSTLMLVGRLEIFGFLLAFYPPAWKGSWS